jgi:hypothetical protein
VLHTAHSSQPTPTVTRYKQASRIRSPIAAPKNPQKMASKCHFTLLCFLCFFLANSVTAQNPTFACDIQSTPSLASYGFCNTSWSFADRATDLVKRLTLQEKIGFLVNKAIAVSRFGIPSYEWWSEALHGVSYVGPGTHFSSLVPGATSFPMPILTAASFNSSLFEAIGRVSSSFISLHIFKGSFSLPFDLHWHFVDLFSLLFLIWLLFLCWLGDFNAA